MSSKSVERAPRRRLRAGLMGATAAIALVTAGLVGTGALVGAGTTPVVAQAMPAASQVLGPDTFIVLAEKVKPAVVSIRVAGERTDEAGPSGASPFDDFFRRFFEDDPRFRQFERRFGDGPRAPRRFRTMAQGSGFLISADGYIVTNNHVIDGGKDIKVVMDDGSEHDAELVGTDGRTDLAVIKIDGNDLPHVSWTDRKPQVGEWVMAVGNPFGLGGTVTTGIISASGRVIGSSPYDDFIQIDAAVNRGNSGGPTFNLDGEVIGVNTAIYSPNGGSVGIGFAISAEMARDVAANLIENGSVTRGWLGVSIQNVTSDIARGLGLSRPGGALVAEVTSGSPAADAGLEPGDAVLAVGDEEIENTRDLARTIAGIRPGETAELTLWRDGKEVKLPVEIGTLPGQERLAALQKGGDDSGAKAASYRQLGLEVRPVAGDDGAGGVEVARVRPGSDADDKGFRPGDRIVEVAGVKVASVADFDRAIGKATEDGLSSILVLVRSNDRQRFVSLKLEHA